MKKLCILLVCCSAIVGFSPSIFAETERLEANVAHGPTSDAFVCIASLTGVPSHTALLVESVETRAGEEAEKVWGKEDSDGNGYEYRLTCTVNSSGAAADVELRRTRFESGKATSYTQFATKVTIR